MNLQSRFVVIAVLAALLIGTTSLSATAFAGKPKDPNCFGEEASKLGQSGEMAKHASNPDPSDPDHDTPRQRIGNLAPHPSDLAEALNGANNCETK